MKETGKIILQYLERFPDLPIKTLANKIYNENNQLYRNAEWVRQHIKYYKGKNGKTQLSHLKNKKLFLVKHH